MNSAQVFNFQRQQVRTIIENGQPWFVALDIARLLGYIKPDKEMRRICKHVKLLKGTKLVPLGIAPRGLLIIPESDVWRLIIRSTLPKAQEIENWIMSEVLPAIRKTGKYEAAPTQAALPVYEAPVPIQPSYHERLERVWVKFDEQSQEFRKWMQAVHREVGKITGPMYKEALHKLTNGRSETTLVCLDLPVEHLHHYRNAAIGLANDSIRNMFDAISLARRYAKMLDM
jgi:prophage antirepressor-like protein